MNKQTLKIMLAYIGVLTGAGLASYGTPKKLYF